jgi:glutamine---fructose-6-phosphate transaminase (isomerizing)
MPFWLAATSMAWKRSAGSHARKTRRQGLRCPPTAQEPIRPDVLIRQAEGLPADLAEHVAPVSDRIAGLLSDSEWAGIGTVYLTGDGDSFHAACAAEMAFESLGGVTCEPLSALRFLEYHAPWLRPGQARTGARC